MVLPSKIPKFAIQHDNSGHNEIDIFYQGRTCIEHSRVLKIANFYSEREETRTNTNHSKWSPLLTFLHSIPLVFHFQSVSTRSQIPI